MEKAKKTDLFRQFGTWALDIALVTAAVGLGTACRSRIDDPMPGLVLSALTVLILSAGSIIGNHFFENWLNHVKVRSIHGLTDRRRSRILENEGRERRHLVLACWLVRGYVAALTASVLAAGFFCAQVAELSVVVTVNVTACFFLYGFLSRLFLKEDKPDKTKALPETQYPLLYALVRKAAGVDRRSPIYIFLANPDPDEECNAGVLHHSDGIYLLLGPMLLCTASEEELLQVLRHEFAHVDLEHTSQIRTYDRLLSYLTASRDMFDLWANLVLKLPVSWLLFEGQFYFTFSNAAKEANADARAADAGDDFAQASILAKLQAHSLYIYEQEPRINIYRSEIMPTDFTTARIRDFREALSRREADWRKIMEHEIPSRTATHPTFRQRWEALGCCEYFLVPACEDTPFARECWAAAAESDRRMSAMSQERYEKLRKENYLSHLEILTEWEKEDKLLSPEEMRPVVIAAYSLGMPEKTEAICDRMIRENDSIFATAFARYWKGVLMLCRYDRGGLAYLYQAMESNPNYIQDGLEHIGRFCTMMGLQEELEEYRSRAADLMQTRRDRSAGGIHGKADLSPEQLPQGWQTEILDYILKTGGDAISQVYLVRENTGSGFTPSAFVLRYREGTPEEEQSRIYDCVFRLLDDWPTDHDFCLYDYEAGMKKPLEKVPGACIYDADRT